MVDATIASLVPIECPVGGILGGISGEPLERALWNTTGLHSELAQCENAGPHMKMTCPKTYPSSCAKTGSGLATSLCSGDQHFHISAR